MTSKCRRPAIEAKSLDQLIYRYECEQRYQATGASLGLTNCREDSFRPQIAGHYRKLLSNRLNVYPIKGKLISGDSSCCPRPWPLAACWARRTVALSVWSISSVGKYVVSMLEVNRGSKGARILRRPSNSTPRKKAWLLISCAPPRPRRFSVLQMRLNS